MWNRTGVGLAGLAVVVFGFACGLRIEESSLTAQEDESSACVIELQYDTRFAYVMCDGKDAERAYVPDSNRRGQGASLVVSEKLKAGYRLVNCTDVERLTRCYMVK